MNSEKINVEVSGQCSELVIRHGDAEKLKEPVKITLRGDIKSVSEFISKRPNDALLEEGFPGLAAQRIITDRAVVVADKEAGTITLSLAPSDYYGTEVIAKLEPSKELELFQINEQAEYSREDLIKLFRFNKIHFADPVKCDELVRSLQKFSAKAYVDFMKEDDNRGNVSAQVNKKVETGLPSGFVLNVPLFKGQPKETVAVEICLDVIGTRAVMWFESVELPQLMEQRKNEIFAAELEACKEFPIINK